MDSGRFPIPLNRLREGAQLCLRNAERLCADADLLRDYKEYATSISLLVLCSEEAAKGLWLSKKAEEGEMVTATEWKKWTRKRAHVRKLRYLRELIKEALGYDIFEPLTDEQAKALKESGLYVDWKRNHEWSAFYERLDEASRFSLYAFVRDIVEEALKLFEGSL